MPLRCELFHLLRRGQVRQFVQLSHRHSDSEIAGGEHIWTPKSENQEHMRRPDSHALHLSQALNDLLIRKPGETGKIDSSFPECEVANVRCLLPGKTDRAGLLFGQLQYSPWTER